MDALQAFTAADTVVLDGVSSDYSVHVDVAGVNVPSGSVDVGGICPIKVPGELTMILNVSALFAGANLQAIFRGSSVGTDASTGLPLVKWTIDQTFGPDGHYLPQLSASVDRVSGSFTTSLSLISPQQSQTCDGSIALFWAGLTTVGSDNHIEIDGRYHASPGINPGINVYVTDIRLIGRAAVPKDLSVRIVGPWTDPCLRTVVEGQASYFIAAVAGVPPGDSGSLKWTVLSGGQIIGSDSHNIALVKVASPIVEQLSVTVEVTVPGETARATRILDPLPLAWVGVVQAACKMRHLMKKWLVLPRPDPSNPAFLRSVDQQLKELTTIQQQLTSLKSRFGELGNRIGAASGHR